MSSHFNTAAAIAVLIVLTLTGCSSMPFMGDRSSENQPTATTTIATPSEPAAGGQDEADLERIIAAQVEDANAEYEAKRAELVRKRPYYYKEYEYYPDGATFMDMTTRETGSRTAPMVADVSLRKQRYVTKLHRDREAARNDNDFLRDTGEETITYELRNGKWRRVASLFVAESVEQNIDGVWMPVEEVERTDDPEGEEDLSWFGRIWANVTGR
jgi:hypothetical protein